MEYFLSKLFSLAKLCSMALQQKGWTQTELAKYLGLQQSTVSKILRGYKSSLDEDRISMLYDLVGNVSEDSPALRTDHYATVQQYDVIASAGYGSFIHGETGEEVLVRTEWLPNSAAQRNLSCIKISGDSMLPTIGSDDHVVHELDQRYSGPGLYVVRHRDTLLCKRLEVLLNGNIKIKSDNNVYSEEVLQNDDPDAEQFRKKLGTAAEFVGMSPQERALILSERLAALRLELGLQNEGTLVTFQKAVERFLAHCETRNSPRTVYTYGDSLKRWQQANGNPAVQDYQRSQLDNYIAQERNRGLNDRTINHHIRNVQRFFNWAYEEELVDRPFKLKQLRAVTVVPQTWSREELELMREYIERKLKETGSRRFVVLRRAFFLFRYTGMRASELIHLKWDHISHQGIWLESDKDWQTKGRADAILPVAKPLRQFLDAEGHDDEVYVCDDGSGGKFWRDYSSAGHSFQKMLDQLGLKGPKVLHGFRATVATELLAAGESPVLVQKLLRHQQLTTTLGYLNSQTVEVQDLVNKL